MKFTVAFVTLLSISSTWAVLARLDEPKDKREAPSHYPSSSSGHSASNYQAPSTNHGDANAISVGAGYSIGGAKPVYSFNGHGLGSAGSQFSGEGSQSGHGGSIQLAPITLQPGQDLAQLMSQLQHSLGSSALSLQPSNSVAEFHETSHGGQQVSYPQLQQYAAPQYQYQLAGQIASAPSYATGLKGLSSYGQTGPVLFNPSQEHGGQPASLSYAVPSGGHGDAGSLSLGGGHPLAGLSLGSGYSFGGAPLSSGGPGYSLGGLGHSLGGAGLSFDGSGYNFGGSGHSLGGSEHGLGSSGYSLGSLSNSGHSLGGPGLSLGSAYTFGSPDHSQGASGHSHGGSGSQSLGSSSQSQSGSGSSHRGSGQSNGGPSSSGTRYKVVTNHGAPKSSFKPSTFLGASIPSESGASSSHGAHSFPTFSATHESLSLGGHGSFPTFAGFGGPSKHISPLYTKAEGSYDSAGAYSSAGQFASPPGTTYGFPASSYSASGVQAASSSGPQYYISSSKYPSSFGEGSSYKSPGSSQSSLSSSGPKYSFGGHGISSRYSSPKDSHGAYSETSYNTIKYSEELKPRAH